MNYKKIKEELNQNQLQIVEALGLNDAKWILYSYIEHVMEYIFDHYKKTYQDMVVRSTQELSKKSFVTEQMILHFSIIIEQERIFIYDTWKEMTYQKLNYFTKVLKDEQIIMDPIVKLIFDSIHESSRLTEILVIEEEINRLKSKSGVINDPEYTKFINEYIKEVHDTYVQLNAFQMTQRGLYIQYKTFLENQKQNKQIKQEDYDRIVAKLKEPILD